MFKIITLNSIQILILLSIGFTAQAATKGASVTTRHGVVENTQQVQLQSKAGAGAVVGGVVGYNLNSGKSSSKQRRRTAAGAAVGAAGTRAAEGDLTGMEYTVKMTDGSQIRLVSDQTQIHKGDCVAIEQSGDKANIRRVDKAQCE